jgi:glutathione S-transferase
MKLFYSPGACSLSPHIVASEAGLELQLQKVDTKTHTLAGGGDFYAINPKGYVPLLQLDNGEYLTEGPAIVQYLADQKPSSKLAPANGTLERYRLQEMLGFINSEIHKSYGPLFNSKTLPEVRDEAIEKLKKRFGREYLIGDNFTAADAYLFVVTGWADHVKVDLSEFPNLMAFKKRVAARPAVQKAMKEEGLLK